MRLTCRHSRAKVPGLFAWLATFGLFAAQGSAGEKEDPSLLTVARIYDSKEFDPERFSARWLEDSSGYLTLESSKDPAGGRDIIQHDPSTGESEILVSAAHLVPPGETAPLGIDDYALSKDRSLVLIYTNSKRVWRRNTRGDSWVLDRASRELRKLGGDCPPSNTGATPSRFRFSASSWSLARSLPEPARSYWSGHSYRRSWSCLPGCAWCLRPPSRSWLESPSN